MIKNYYLLTFTFFIGLLVNAQTISNLSNWYPNNNVRTILEHGDYVYIGGEFTNVSNGVNPVTRNRLARYNRNSMVLDQNWNPDVNGPVFTMVISNNELIIGGQFTSVGSTTRNRIAKVSITGAGSVILNWDPNVGATFNNSNVYRLIENGNHIYLGGYFENVGGETRNNIARILTTTGAVDLDWNPNLDGSILGMEIINSSIFIGGSFNNVGGTPRSKLAKIDISGTGTVDTDWNPDANANATIRSMAVGGTDLYVGGTFTSIGGTTRMNIAKISSEGTGALDPDWNPNLNNAVWSILPVNNAVYIGGSFTTVGSITRNNICKISPSGELSSWNPNADNMALSMHFAGNRLYVGGSFTNISNLGVLRFATYDVFPSISTNGPVSGLTSVYGSPSSPATLSISGTDLLSDLTISIPSEFEASLSAGSDYTNSLIVPADGDLNNTAVYVRLKDNLDVNTYSSAIMYASSTGINDYAIPINTSTITPKSLTISGLVAENKEFDGNTTATITGTPILNGIIGSDIVTIQGTPIGTFDNPNVGTNKVVTVTGLSLNQSTPLNYNLSPLTLTANITQNAVGINEESNMYFKLFPNPTKDNLTISTQSNMSISIVNLLGEQLMKADLSEGQNLIETERFVPGVYLIETSKGQTIRFVKI
jgi:hypothetical protein